MGWRDGISDIIELHNLNPSLQYWMKVLTWADDHKDNLTISDLEALAYESERCRKLWNKDKETTRIFPKNGKLHEQKVKMKGLDIKKEDVYPNIHKIIELKLEEQLEDSQTYPEVQSPVEAKMVALPHNK